MMASPPVSAAASGPSAPAESRRLWSVAEGCRSAPDPSALLAALKDFLVFVETHRRGLEGEAGALAPHLDEAALTFYRLAQPELALRAADLGLGLVPGNASLLHHKALVLMALNRSVDQLVPLLDDALRANPHDKAIWATKGDALRLLGRGPEAVEAYLTAQRLDATSTQYVDRALKTVPDHPEALRLKVQLARTLGGDRSALAALDALLQKAPGDPELRRNRAELLARLGDRAGALAALGSLREELPDDRPTQLLYARLLLEANDLERAGPELRRLLDAPLPDPASAVGELAALLEKSGADDGLALELRHKLAEGDPRNVANLLALRDLAMKGQRLDTAEDACRRILAVSEDNLEATRGLAEVLLQKAQYDEAFAAYRTLLAKHPSAAAEGRRALEVAQGMGRASEALEFAEAVLKADPKDNNARRLRAEGLVKRGDLAGGLAEYELWIASAPDELAPRLAQKQLLLELGLTERLAPVYDELFRLDPSRTDLALERANLALGRAFEAAQGSEARRDAARTALVSYERASTDPERRGPSLLGIGRASRLLNQPEPAITAYRELLAMAGQDGRVDVRKELGHALREAGRLSEAEAEYDRAIQQGSEEADLLWGAVEVLAQLNQEERALRLVDLLLQREPQNALFLRRKGQLLLKVGRRGEGLAALRAAVERTGSDPHVLFEVAEALRASGAYVDAVGFFRQGLALDPKSRPGRLALAETLLLAGQYPEAVAAIDALLKEDPNDPRAWGARADAFRALARPAEVLYSLKAILLLEPQNGPALLEKARLHLDRHEPREAYEALAALTSSGGPEASDGAVWLQLGDLASELGEIEAANHAYERAAQLDPAHASEIRLRRARLRLTAGRPDLALEVLDAPEEGAAAGAERPIATLLLRAEVLTALERPADAQSVLEGVRQREPRSPIVLSGLARALLDQGKHADARALLLEALPQVPPQESLYLLLAEAETGLGQLDEATASLRKGVQLLPKSLPLLRRLGEQLIAQEAWPDAAGALNRAIALEGQDVTLLLRAGYVAERLGHPNEALVQYERATQVAPANKDAWNQRGLALLAVGRPEEALPSFERALALDSDFTAAKEGKKAALQKNREAHIDRYGREGLLLEARLHRPVTRNDLFVTLHVPFDLLDPVLSALGRQPKIALDALSPTEVQDLESASYHLIASALERRPEGIERRGFTLADVAVLCPPDYPLERIQRLFGYVRAVLEADLRAENLRLTPDLEELARRALQLPETQRTLFQLVRTLRVGVYKARLIRLVEESGGAAHAPVPALDLGQYSPEFRAASPTSEPDGTQFFAPENVPSWDAAPVAGGAGAPPPPKAGAAHAKGHRAAASAVAPSTARCVGCGGLASVQHACGATLCQACLATFRTCPKCQLAIQVASVRTLSGAAPPAAETAHPSATPATPGPTASGKGGPGSNAATTAHPTHTTHPAAAHAHPAPTAKTEAAPHPHAPERSSAPEGKATAAPTTHEKGEPAPPERPPRPAHRTDDEPRL